MSVNLLSHVTTNKIILLLSRLVGDAAKNQMTMNPANTVYDVKRLIGREWTDEMVQEEILHLPFKVIFKTIMDIYCLFIKEKAWS